MRAALNRPELYHLYQLMGGFFGARLKAFKDYLDFSGVRRIFDIGCGPGHIALHIPNGIEYIGFDTEPRYIDFANRAFGARGRFVVREFNRSAVDAFGQPDLILMNGVLHHLDDETASAVLRDAASMLTGRGTLFALDGCFQAGQNPIGHYLLKQDRGRFVREAAGYQGLVRQAFASSEVFVRNDLSWVPYTFAITKGQVSKARDHGPRIVN